MVSCVSIPCIPNHMNLVVYPAKDKVNYQYCFLSINEIIQEASSVYVLSTNEVKLQWSHSRQVEFEEGYIYCLLPSIGTEQGFARTYTRMPNFVMDLPCHQFLGKVFLK